MKKLGEKYRKKIQLLLCTVCLIICVCGCSNSKSTTSFDIDPNSISQENITSRIVCVELDRIYEDNITRSKESSYIVYGEITDLHYELHENGNVETHCDVNVKKCIKGHFNEGETIKVIELQGLCPIKDYINSFGDDADLMRENYLGYLSDEEIETKYYQLILPDDMMVQVGDKIVYYLEKAVDYRTNHSYVPSTLGNSKFLEIDDNSFSLVTLLASRNNENVPINEYGEKPIIDLPTYTLEDLISDVK